MNGPDLLAYAEQVLVPTLTPRDEILATYPPTKFPSRTTVEAKYSCVRLPPLYSLDLSPFEQAVTKR